MAGRNPLGSLFGRSPIRPIQEHMQMADQAAQLLPDLFSACEAQDWQAVSDITAEIAKAERAADKLKRSVRRHLPKSLFLPVPRSDLLGLVSIQDSVANTAKDIAVIVKGRQMRFPDKLIPALEDYVEATAATSHQALKAIQELDELLEVGFSGREVKLVEDMLKELDKLERVTDKHGAAVRAKLFRMEQELPPVDVMFYYRILSLLGSVADHAESVGDRLQTLLAH